ncbi:MAG: ATP-binding cassette domain-containing protein [Geminicoccaceae bacterium]
MPKSDAQKLRPAAGRITWDEADVADDLPACRAHVGLVAHTDAVKPLLSVAENLRASAGLLGAPADLIPAAGSPDGCPALGFTGGTGLSRVTEAGITPALNGFDLAWLEGTLGRFLSSGQRRRAALARLLAAPRPLWLLDEPGVGLDRASRGRLEATIAAHRQAGGICVVASHGDVAVPDPLVLDFGG